MMREDCNFSSLHRSSSQNTTDWTKNRHAHRQYQSFALKYIAPRADDYGPLQQWVSDEWGSYMRGDRDRQYHLSIRTRHLLRSRFGNHFIPWQNISPLITILEEM